MTVDAQQRMEQKRTGTDHDLLASGTLSVAHGFDKAAHEIANARELTDYDNWPQVPCGYKRCASKGQ